MRWRPTESAGPLAVVGSNLVAPVGVVLFGWSTTVLLGVFLLELVAVVCWSVVKIPFAAKRPNNMLSEQDRLLGVLQTKRGSLASPGPLPPVYPRNLPTLAITAFLFAPLEIAIALGVFGFVDPALTPTDAAALVVGGIAVCCSRGVETVEFLRGGYRDHSPRSVLLGPFRHLFGVSVLFVVAGGLDAGGSGVLLGCIVAGKLLYDLQTLQVENTDGRGIFYRLYGGAETEIEPVPVEVPAREPTLRVRTDRRVAVVDVLYYGLRYTFTSQVLGCYLVAVFLLGIGAYRFAAFALAIAVGFGAVRGLGRYLRYGPLEYRCYDGTLVVYDRLLDEPQARLDRSAVTELAADTDAVDRLFGTRTVRFETPVEDSPTVYFTVPDPEEIKGDDANRNRPLRLPHIEALGEIVDSLNVRWIAERDLPETLSSESSAR